jgi:hypothetical protein
MMRVSRLFLLFAVLLGVLTLALPGIADAAPTQIERPASSPYDCWNVVTFQSRVCYQIVSKYNPSDIITEFKGEVDSYSHVSQEIWVSVEGPSGVWGPDPLIAYANSNEPWSILLPEIPPNPDNPPGSGQFLLPGEYWVHYSSFNFKYTFKESFTVHP